jgi:hypothetical protein
MGLLVDFTVLVPYASTDPQRDAARQFVVEWLAPLGWPIVVADGDPDRPWSKGAALAATVGSVDTPGLVIHDADVIVEHAALTSCAQAVVAGHAWAQPHRDVYRLSRRATHMVLARQMFGPHHFLAGTALERRPHAGPPGGGIVFLSRAAYDTVGGIDPRFVGWGGEDISFARALDTLVGPAFRLAAPMWHLWHPPQPMVEPRRGSPETERLASRYLDAVGDVERMREVVTR